MPLTYAAVKDELDAARTQQELIDASQLIQFVLSIDDRDKLGGVVKQRLEEFKPKQHTAN